MTHPSENSSNSDHFSGFNKLNHEELLARGIMSDAFSMDMSQWQAPEPEDLENLLTDYQVLGFLGRGGMGAVYRVLQPDLERECALKLLPLEVSVAPGFEQRFLSEARAMAKLDHPNIVTIYDFGRTTEGHLYYVMECIEGTDLQALIQDGGLDISGALDVVSQVCEALDYAHTAGYVHRDIKPANILVNTKGMVKVTDFGLAKLLNPNPSDTPSYGMTMTGQVMGTPDYMAPEQASGQAVDQRADIYALGVLLYEMLTGSLPKGIFSPPSQKVAVDVRVDEVVIRALQQEPEKRYQQASEIKTSIDNILNKPDSSDQEEHIRELVEEQLNTHPETATTHPESPQKPNKSLTPLIAGCTILLIGIITWFTLRPDNKTSNNPPNSTASKTSNTPPPDTSLWPVQDEKHTNTLGIPFVPVSGTDVLFSVWETRRKDWDKFLRETDYQWEKPSFNGPGDHPAPNISWHDANAYCKWLTEKERASGNIGPDMEYRLPTDLEWSAAVGLGKEEGEDPETRSAKVKGLYPWGKAWPAPEDVKGEVDGGDPVTISTAILDGFHLFSKIHTNHWKYSDYAGKAWYNVRPLVQNCSHRIYDVYKPIFGILGLRKHIFFHVDDKTFVVLPNAIMGHITDFMIHVTGWEYAYWNDPSFRKAISEGNIKLDLNSEYWTGAKWINDKWIYKSSVYERTLFSDDQSYKKNLALVVKYNKENLTYFSDTSSKIHKTIIVFKGTLSKEQINAEMALGFNKFKKLWQDGATKIIDELLPKYENDWQQKIQPVDQLWENPFGIKGLAGSQREWVWDKYNSQDNKTLRGGALRSDARGPQLSTLPKGNKKIEAFCQDVVPAKTAFLSFHRGNAKPAARKPWNGFRPVLAFTK